jgi:hypothetical protein
METANGFNCHFEKADKGQDGARTTSSIQIRRKPLWTEHGAFEMHPTDELRRVGGF